MPRPRTRLAKLTRPRLAQIVERPRLFAILERASDGRLIWVSGPAGSGKTTLAASWIAARQRHCVWVRIDEGDSDPATFFHYLALAAEQATPRRKSRLPALTPEYLPGLPVFARNFARRLFSRFREPLTLVLDNLESLADGSHIEAVLPRLVEEVPEGHCILACSRSEPAPGLLQLELGGTLQRIGWEQLRFDPAEARALMTLRSGQRVDDATACEAVEQTNGWAAGLALLTADGGNPAAASPDTSRDRILDHMSASALGRADPDLRSAMLKLAVVPYFTATIASRLTGAPDARALLETIARRNLFVARYPGSETVYRFHPLMLDCVRREISRQFDADELRRLQAAGAAALEESGDVESAAQLYAAGGQWTPLTRLLGRHGHAFLQRGRWATLARLLSAAPADAFAREPWLHYWRGLSALPTDPARALSHLESGWQAFRSGEDAGLLYLFWCGIAEACLYAHEFRPFGRWLGELDALRGRFGPAPDPLLEARVVANALPAVVLWQPDHPDHAEVIAAGRALVESDAPAELRLGAATILVFWHTWRSGDRGKATEIVALASPLARSVRVAPAMRAHWYCFESQFHLWYTQDPEILDQCVERAVQIVEDEGVSSFMYPALVMRAYRWIYSSQPARAAQDIEQLDRMAIPLSAYDEGLKEYLLAFFALATGRPEAARDHAARSAMLAQRSGAPSATTFSDTLVALVHLAQGRRREAVRLLAATRRYCARMRFTNMESVALFGLALCARVSGRRRRLRILLREAMARAARDQLICLPSLTREHLAQLCAEALAAAIEPEYVLLLIKARRLAPPAGHVGEGWPWSAQVATLGSFRLRVGDAPVAYGRKAPRKPLQLIQALVALGRGRGVGEAELIDALWPGDDTSSAHRALITTTHRARRLIGEESIVSGEGRLALNSSCVHVDAWAFEDRLSRARTAEEQRAALAAYPGHFLAGETDEHWCVAYRERLRGRFLSACAELGARLEREADWQGALSAYARGLDIDELPETLHQGAIRCHAALGHRAEAIEAFRRCERVLARLLGVAPSQQTHALYQRLLTG